MGKNNYEGSSILCGIYKITCIKNGKVYIGSSMRIFTRWSNHISELEKRRHHSRYLQLDYNKYGLENFTFQIVKILEPNSTKSEIAIQEQLIMDKYDAINLGYNIAGAIKQKKDIPNDVVLSNRDSSVFYDEEAKSILREYVSVYTDSKKLFYENQTLSLAWFSKANKSDITQLKKHMLNFYYNIIGVDGYDCCWTTYIQYKNVLKVNGLVKRYLTEDEVSVEKKQCLLFIKNPSMNVINIIQNKAIDESFDVNLENKIYRISTLANWVLNNGDFTKEIHLYIPNRNLRDEFIEWMKS